MKLLYVNNSCFSLTLRLCVSHIKFLQVIFIGEEAEDGGGPLREFWRLFAHAWQCLHASPSNFEAASQCSQHWYRDKRLLAEDTHRYVLNQQDIV